MTLHNSLPFTSEDFFLYIGIVAFLFQLIFRLPLEQIKKSWMTASVSALYIALLYPKPLAMLSLVIYFYVIFFTLRKYCKNQSLFIPYLLFSMPMIGMKSLALIDLEGPLGILQILQIAGISYMTFKIIGMYVDERNSDIQVNAIDFISFTCFPPTLLIGPIDRFKRFKSDLDSRSQFISNDHLTLALNRILKGLLYKYILAYTMNVFLLSHLENDGSTLYHVTYMYTYLLYLFFDFAGYSLLAIGFGNLMGFDVPINFDKPFNALNPKEFWRKWHKSLGDWLNDYFFRPIFKYLTQKQIFNSIQRQSIGLFLTFTLMGFWNGFQKHYIISGMLFGLYSLIHNYYQHLCRKHKRDVFFGSLPESLKRYISIAIMFNAVAFAIYIFSGNLI